MKYVTSGYLQRLFANYDPDTILRRPNIRRFTVQYGVPHEIHETAWLIDFKAFMQAIAPKRYLSQNNVPRIRSIQGIVTEYNATHPEKINCHDVKLCMQNKRIFVCKCNDTWIVNYDQIEPILNRYCSKRNCHTSHKDTIPIP